MNVLWESILFFLMFFFIRIFAGGYHASTETRCELISTLSVLACVALIRLSKAHDFQTAMLIVTALSSVCIFLLCPLDTPEKPLTEKEFKTFRKKTWIVLFVISAVIVISIIGKCDFIMYPACLSLILESILLITGKVKQAILKEKDVKE